mgnify:CR=1 FL=1
MKKMLKRLGVVIPSTILTLLMAVGFSTPAFAFVDTTEVAEEPVQVIEEAEPTEEEKIPFTIAGNGEVEDNIVDDPSKEFFTVKTKGGNTFFLVIDRARNSENVYMLSMIDEYDLQEFLDDEERNGKQEEETPAVVLPETKPEPTPDVEIEEPKEESGMPSAHSATVCALLVATGRYCGTGSTEFALALVLAIIVMYDAMGVRRETGEQAKILNRMLSEWMDRESDAMPFLGDKKLKEMVGHTPIQVLTGAIFGIAVGLLMPMV